VAAAIAIVIGCYLIGAVPSGLLVGKIGYGLDIRQHGSGNIGFTNARRVLGDKGGFLVLALDVFKGAGAVLAAAWLWSGQWSWPIQPSSTQAVLIILSGLAVIVGNQFPVFIGFKGGKGVGVAAGVMLAIVPVLVAALLAVWYLVRAAFGYVSVASLTIALLFPVLMWLTHRSNQPYLIFSIVAAALVIFSHRDNIKRLLAGTEPKAAKFRGHNT
jgi:acyl phosphate:glycerol-3-phosphate acyltransferase